MSFQVGNYLKIMRLAVRGRPNRKLLTTRLTTLQVLAAWSFVNSAFQQLDRVLYPRRTQDRGQGAGVHHRSRKERNYVLPPTSLPR